LPLQCKRKTGIHSSPNNRAIVCDFEEASAGAM
jgi:hypothetical protein